MNIAICDDEKEIRNIIEQHIKLFFGDRGISFICYQFSNGSELIASGLAFDIVFLDIETESPLNGIETAKMLNQKSKNTLIFIVTAFREYLDEAMDLKVFRFIDKPINSKRIYAGLEKALDYIDNNEISFSTREDGFITIKKNDILYVEILHKRVYVSTTDKQYVAKENLDFFKTRLTASYFVIPHNSYVVNLNYVSKFQREKLTMNNGYEISVASKKQSEVKRRFIKLIGDR